MTQAVKTEAAEAVEVRGTGVGRAAGLTAVRGKADGTGALALLAWLGWALTRFHAGHVRRLWDVASRRPAALGPP